MKERDCVHVCVCRCVREKLIQTIPSSLPVLSPLAQNSFLPDILYAVIDWLNCRRIECIYGTSLEKAMAPHSSTRLENPMDGGAW